MTFFPHFRESPPPKVEVLVCRDMSCHLRKSLSILNELTVWADEKWDSKEVEICGASCLGRCDRPPAALINERLFVHRDAEQLKEIICRVMHDEEPEADRDLDLVRKRAGTWRIDVYDGQPGYEAVRRYLSDTKPNPFSLFGDSSEPEDGQDGALTIAGLLGMGGAGGRAYKKWRDVYFAKGSDSSDKFVVCNADESEPGTFKDRDLLLVAPHLTIEGMILAGLSVGASRGWVYVRHEYAEQVEAVAKEIQNARRMRALGKNIFGSDLSFDIDIFVSPGGYICGEQTALIEAMEDKRAEPRNRPPELSTNGFRNQPTLLSNVETFAWVPAILLGNEHVAGVAAGANSQTAEQPGAWFAAQGRKSGPWTVKGMRGLRLFSVSGDVNQPGVYEVPTGIPLGELIDDYCGGMRDGKQLFAAALSGPSGGIVPARFPIAALNSRFVQNSNAVGTTHIDLREIPLDIAVSRAMGIMIGAGIVIYGSGTNILEEAWLAAAFMSRKPAASVCHVGSAQSGSRKWANSCWRARFTKLFCRSLWIRRINCPASWSKRASVVSARSRVILCAAF